MSEQRDSINSIGAISERSSLGPDLREEYVTIYKSEKASFVEKDKDK